MKVQIGRIIEAMMRTLAAQTQVHFASNSGLRSTDNNTKNTAGVTSTYTQKPAIVYQMRYGVPIKCYNCGVDRHVSKHCQKQLSSPEERFEWRQVDQENVRY
jgi:hypothetical protein